VKDLGEGVTSQARCERRSAFGASNEGIKSREGRKKENEDGRDGAFCRQDQPQAHFRRLPDLAVFASIRKPVKRLPVVLTTFSRHRGSIASICASIFGHRSYSMTEDSIRGIYAFHFCGIFI
jgi:hypothetical protein